MKHRRLLGVPRGSPRCAYFPRGVIAFSTKGGHIETFIKLAPGTHDTVVQAWDKCGGVGKAAVTVSVISQMGVTIFLPASSSGNIPDHIAASAESPSCAGGVSSIRIYTAGGVSPYSVHSNQLNAFVNLLPGNYTFTVQASDKCGHVLKTSFGQTLSASVDGYLYAVESGGPLSRLQISNGLLSNSNGSGKPPQLMVGNNPSAVATDPGGWFVYQVAQDGIYGFQINQSNGALMPMPASPFPGKNAGHSTSEDIFVDPDGNFLFVSYFGTDTIAAYKIDRSTGALANTATVQLGGIIGSGVLAISTDFSGQYLYGLRQETSYTVTHIVGYKVNKDGGALIPVPGSPFTESNGGQGYALSAAHNYLYAGDRGAFGSSGGIFAYAVNFNTGALSLVSGSPFPNDGENTLPQSLLADDRERYLWTTNSNGFPQEQFWLAKFDILSGGGLGSPSQTPKTAIQDVVLAEDRSGKYVYVSGLAGAAACKTVCTAVTAFSVSSNGDLVKLSGPVVWPGLGGISIAAARKHGD